MTRRRLIFIEEPHAVAPAMSRTLSKACEKTSYGGAQHPPVLGTVTHRDSLTGTADVECIDGRIFKTVPVASPYWAGPASGGRDLPPLGALVLLLFIDGIQDRPIITGSVASSSVPWQKDTFFVPQKEREKITVLESGWQFTSDTETGIIKWESSNDQDALVIEFDPGEKKITLKIGEVEFKISDSHLSLKTAARSLKALLFALIDKIEALQTIGSAAAQAVSPATIAALEAFKADVARLFED